MSVGKGENTAIIQLKLKLLNYVNEHCGHEKQSRGFYIAKRWLMNDPDVRIALGEELYQEMLQWYSKTNIQQHEENVMETEARQIRKEAREKIQGIKNQYMQTISTVMNDKHEDRTEEKDRKDKLSERLRRPSEDEKTLSILENYQLSPEQLKDAGFMAKHNKRIAELKQKIAAQQPQ